MTDSDLVNLTDPFDSFKEPLGREDGGFEIGAPSNSVHNIIFSNYVTPNGAPHPEVPLVSGEDPEVPEPVSGIINLKEKMFRHIKEQAQISGRMPSQQIYTPVNVPKVLEFSSPEVIGKLPLHSYDPVMFLPLDHRLQNVLKGLLPSDPRCRSVGMMWLHHASLSAGVHWTNFVEYHEYDFSDDVFDDFYQDTPVYEPEADLLVSNVISCFDEEASGIDSPDFLEFDDSCLVKCFSVDEAYPDAAVGRFLNSQGFNVVGLGPSKFAFYPTHSMVPNNFDFIRTGCKSGYMPRLLQSLLIKVSVDRSKDLNCSMFVLDDEDMGDPPFESVVNGKDEVSALVKEALNNSISDPGGSRSKVSRVSGGKQSPFDKFNEIVGDEFDHFGYDEYFLSSDGLDEFLQYEPSASFINMVMTGSVLRYMDSRVKKFLKRLGLFFIYGKSRYMYIYKLLHVSGAFKILRSKLCNDQSYLWAMKIWIYRSPLISDPHALKLEFNH
jgi:hypothetical protein